MIERIERPGVVSDQPEPKNKMKKITLILFLITIIFSASGQVMRIENISHAGGSFSQSTPLNNIKSGLYIYTISGPVIMQKKFIVQ